MKSTQIIVNVGKKDSRDANAIHDAGKYVLNYNRRRHHTDFPVNKNDVDQLTFSEGKFDRLEICVGVKLYKCSMTVTGADHIIDCIDELFKRIGV